MLIKQQNSNSLTIKNNRQFTTEGLKVHNQLKNTNIENQLVIIKEEVNKDKLFRAYDNYINSILLLGVRFFHVTINLYHINLRKHSVKINELLILKEIRDLLLSMKNIPMIDHIFVVIETNEKQIQNMDKNIYPHLHIMVGIRSIFNDFEVFHNTLNSNLMGFENVQLKYKSNFVKIKESGFAYISKQFNHDKNFNYLITTNFSTIKENTEAYKTLIEGIKNAKRNLNLNNPTLVKLFNVNDWNNFEFLNNPTKNLEGFNFRKRISELSFLVYLGKIVFNFYDIILHKNNLYKRIEESKTSWKFLFTIETFYEEHFLNDMTRILNKLKLKGFIGSLNNLFYEHYKKCVAHESLYKLFNQTEINFNLVEFKDGVYTLNNGVFHKFKFLGYGICIIQFQIHYEYINTYLKLKFKENSLWYSLLKTQLDEKDLKSFIINMGYFMYQAPIQKENTKKRKTGNVVLILGVSDSGKSIMLDLIENLIGIQNTGYFNGTDRFNNDNLANYKTIIDHEFQLIKKQRSLYLELFAGGLIPVSSKFKKTKRIKIDANFLLAANAILESNSKNYGIQALIHDPAFRNRAKVFEFNKEIRLTPKNYKRLLKELPKILIFCNKAFLKHKEKEQKQYEKE